MGRRFGAFCSASGLVATALVALGMSPGHAATSFEDWAVVSAGGNHSCGVRENGKLYCWGSDGTGQIGDGDTTGGATVPRRVGTFEDWSLVAAGNDFGCGIRHGGKLYCWGENFYGQLGDGASGSGHERTTPTRIGSFEDWASVEAGFSHTCGIRKNSKLYCWGDDGSGQVGDGGDGHNIVPIKIPKRIGTFEDWATVSAGNFHTCGVRKNGKLYCWGDDTYGQLGTPSGEATDPLRVGTYEDWSRVSAGSDHTCGIRHGGKLYCWGSGAFGKLGNDDDSTTPKQFPQRIGTFEDWASVTTGVNHTCGLRKNGKLYCWGDDTYGQVGDGLSIEPAMTPRRIGDFLDWAKVSAGTSHTCGVRSNGKLYCWGNDENGQVGDGDDGGDPHKSPTRV